jgi:DNA-binding NtrC family response regulator
MSFSDLDALLGASKGSHDTPARHPVVIIDDDPGIRKSLELLLIDRYQLTLCATAEAGVAAVNEDTCAVILDVKMGMRDGFWACNEIRKKVSDMPVIFFSAYQNLKDPYAIINEHRPFGYIAKGDDIRKLVEMLDVAVMLQAMIVTNRKLIKSIDEAQKLIL